MKKTVFIIVLTMLGALCFAQERIAVFPFEDRNNVFTKDELDSFYIEFTNEFRNRTDDNRFTILDRQEVEKVVNMESAFQLKDYSSKEKTAAMNKVLNAQQIISGLIIRVDDSIRITVSRYTFPEVAVLRGGAAVTLTNKNQYFDKIPELVQSMVTAIAGSGAAVAQAESSPAASISPAPSSASNTDEIISLVGGWITENDNNSSTSVSFGKERIDGRERDVMTVIINLAAGNSRWAGVYSYKTDFVIKLKNANGVRFKILGDGKKWFVQFATSDVTDYAFYRTTISTQNRKVSSVDVPFNSLRQPDWGKKTVFRKNNITTMGIQRDASLGAVGVSTIKIFDFEVY